MTWPLDPSVYAGLVVLFLGHAWLAGTVSDAQRKHSLYFGLGLVTLWFALETPLDTISDHYLDSVHMLQHVLLGFVAPPLMLLGLSPQMVTRLPPRLPGRWREAPVGGPKPAAALARLSAITEPVQAQVIAGVVMVAWHFPPLFDATLYTEWLHVVEHLTFIGAGLVLFWPMLRVTSAHARWQMSPGAKLLYMLVATLPQDGVALALIFSRVPFYEYYTHAPRLVPSLTPLIDQTVSGAVLMILGKATMAVTAAAVFFRWFGSEQRADQAPPARPVSRSGGPKDISRHRRAEPRRGWRG